MKKGVLSILLALGAGGALAINFPVGTFIIKGAVKNYKNALYEGIDRVTVQAVLSDGTIIAEAPVAGVESATEGWNFLLEIPIGTELTAKTAKIGTEVNLFVKDGAALSVAKESVTVTKANGSKELVVGIKNLKTITGSDGKTYQVSQDYLDEITPWMEAHGLSTYEPDGDWDNDGASNHFEYLSGTSPFDPSDKLTITAFSVNMQAKHLLSFEYAGGHVYAIESTTSLENPEWIKEKQVAFSGTEEDADSTTVELLPVVDAPQMFYRVEPL